MANILVLGIGGNVSSGILRVVRKRFGQDRIIGACIGDTYNKIYCDDFVLSPYADSEYFMAWLVATLNNERIDVVLTGVEEIIRFLSVNRDIIFRKAPNAKLALNTSDSIDIGLNKSKTVSWCYEQDISIPESLVSNSIEEIYDFFERTDKGIIMKPVEGKSSEGIDIFKSLEELDRLNLIKEDLRKFVFQQYVGSNQEEYTVGCFQNNVGKVFKPIIFRRELVNGHSMKVEVVSNERISNYCEQVTRKLNPRGPLNVQLRLDDLGNPLLFELNVRFSGTTLIRDYFGFNDVEYMVCSLLKRDVRNDIFSVQSRGYAERVLEEHFYPSKEDIYIDNKTFYG